MPRKRQPSYQLHKSTGQARVRIDGKDHDLGEHGSQESRDRYDELIAEWLDDEESRYTLTIADVTLLYMQHASSYYQKNNEPTCEIGRGNEADAARIVQGLRGIRGSSRRLCCRSRANVRSARRAM